MADNFEQYAKAVFLIGGSAAPRPGGSGKTSVEQGRVDWDADFAVITAFNPDGREPGKDAEGSARLNQAAHLRLKADLLQLQMMGSGLLFTPHRTKGLTPSLERPAKPRWLPAFLHRFLVKLRSAVQPSSCAAPVGLVEVTGCSPDLAHREPGWAANIPLLEALRLGRLYRQDAIFWVSGGALYLVDTRAPKGARGLGGTGALETPQMELLGPWSDRVR